MKIVISGGTGFIGRPLSESLVRAGHHLTILTRRVSRNASRSERVRHVEWNPEDLSHRVREIEGADAVINLAGEPLAAKRWSQGQKEKIINSRVRATQTIVRSIKEAANKPGVLVSASAVGFYGPHGNEELDESVQAGRDFLSDTCKVWEAHAIRAEDFKVRVVRLRIGIVLEQGGGALQKLLPPFRFYMGGWLGGGNQWMSWIHRNDLVKFIHWCLENNDLKGAVNATAPKPVTNKAFSMVLAQMLNRPCLTPVPSFALRLLLGEMASIMLLRGQRVIPKKALDAGFQFEFSDLRSALEDILKNCV